MLFPRSRCYTIRWTTVALFIFFWLACLINTLHTHLSSFHLSDICSDYYLGGGGRQGDEALFGREGEVELGHALELGLQVLPAVEAHVSLHCLFGDEVGV